MPLFQLSGGGGRGGIRAGVVLFKNAFSCQPQTTGGDRWERSAALGPPDNCRPGWEGNKSGDVARGSNRGSSQHSIGSALMALPLLSVRWSLLKFLFRMLFYFIAAEPLPDWDCDRAVCQDELSASCSPSLSSSSSSPMRLKRQPASKVLHFYCRKIFPHIL